MRVVVSAIRKYHAFYLARQLERLGHLARLITSYPAFAVVREGIPRNKVVSLPMAEALHRCWYSLPWVSSRVNIEGAVSALYDGQAARRIPQCDVFVGWSGTSLAGLRKAKQQGAVTVVERGSAHIEEQRDILEQEYRRFGIRPFLPHPRVIAAELREYGEADFISVPSTYVKESFVRKGVPEGKLVVTPYGVDTALFSPARREARKGFRIVYAGAMTLQKGVPHLLRAVHELQLEGCELVLAGGLTREVEPFLNAFRGSYTYAGHVRYQDLPRVYGQADLFVIASLQEGFGMVVLQAMACGLPVVCTDRTGGKDALIPGHTGFVVPAGDVEALKEKIRFFYLDRDAAARFGEASRLRAQEFTWERYGERMVQAYSRMAQARRGAADGREGV